MRGDEEGGGVCDDTSRVGRGERATMVPTKALSQRPAMAKDKEKK